MLSFKNVKLIKYDCEKKIVKNRIFFRKRCFAMTPDLLTILFHIDIILEYISHLSDKPFIHYYTTYVKLSNIHKNISLAYIYIYIYALLLFEIQRYATRTIAVSDVLYIFRGTPKSTGASNPICLQCCALVWAYIYIIFYSPSTTAKKVQLNSIIPRERVHYTL